MLKRLWAAYNRYSAWSLMAWVLTFLALVSAYSFGVVDGLARLLTAVLVGTVVDFLLHRSHTPLFNKRPTSGAITSLIALLVLPFDVSLWILIATIVVALLSKHFLRVNKRHIFNPASFGLVTVGLVTGTTLGWVGDAVMPLTILALIPVVYRVRKHLQVLSFLAIYLVLLVATNIDVLAGSFWQFVPWFFALGMVPEPMTSLPSRRGQLLFGGLVALFSFIFTFIGPLADLALPAALLTGNLAAAYLRTSKL